jgi:hypothetical protein
MAAEFGWLVELEKSPACSPLYLTRNATGGLWWSRKANEAERFATRTAAVAFAGEHCAEPVRIAEHGFGL